MSGAHDLIRHCELEIQQYISEVMSGGMASEEDKQALRALYLCLRTLEQSCPAASGNRSQMALYKQFPHDPLVKLVDAVFGGECGFVFVPSL